MQDGLIKEVPACLQAQTNSRCADPRHQASICRPTPPPSLIAGHQLTPRGPCPAARLLQRSEPILSIHGQRLRGQYAAGSSTASKNGCPDSQQVGPDSLTLLRDRQQFNGRWKRAVALPSLGETKQARPISARQEENQSKQQVGQRERGWLLERHESHQTPAVIKKGRAQPSALQPLCCSRAI